MKDKVVVISGATGSLGPFVAQACALQGACLAFADRSQDKLDELVKAQALSPGRTHARAVNIADENQTRLWCDEVIARFGRMDAVLHLIGGWRGNKSIPLIATADWDFLHEAGIRTTLNLMRACAAPLKLNKGRWVIVSSPMAQQPTATNAIYGAAKAAVEALTLALADEFRGSGATANIIQVKAIVTPQMRAQNPNASYASHTDATDIANAMIYLCSPQATSINGQRLALFEV